MLTRRGIEGQPTEPLVGSRLTLAVPRRRPNEALKALDALKLVPRAEADVGVRIDDFYKRHAVVQKLLGDILVRAMDALYVAHERGRSERRGRKYRDAAAHAPQDASHLADLQSFGAHDATDDDLKKRASLLVNFAALLKTRLGDDVHATLARYEAMML